MNPDPKDDEKRSALVKVGKSVLVAFGNNQRFELLIHDKGQFHRVQCRPGRYGGRFVTVGADTYARTMQDHLPGRLKARSVRLTSLGSIALTTISVILYQ